MHRTEIKLMTTCFANAGRTQFFKGFWIKPHQVCMDRKYHHPCEPKHLSWQWRVKDSSDVQQCNKLCLKKKACPKKRFFPRLKTGHIYKDILSCDSHVDKKKQTWSEYFSYLLPDEYTKKPPMVTCRKMLEHRRRKCMAEDDYQRCLRGECWPLPTEWLGQGVLQVAELKLSKSEPGSVDTTTPCPPPSSMISRCITVKLPVCPVNELSCMDETAPAKMPFSQFRGAENDGSPLSINLKCPKNFAFDLLPSQHQDKTHKLSCKSYGEFKSIECPKQMFNRYMNVDLSSSKLLPIPTSSPGYAPQREVKKGVCGRQTLTRPPSARNFSTGRPLMKEEYPEFVKTAKTSHLQPGRSPVCFEKLVERAGMDAELLQKPLYSHTTSSQKLLSFTDKELEIHELEARRSEESSEDKQKRLDLGKSKLQLLMEKKETETKNTNVAPNDKPVSSEPCFNRMVDLEDVPYLRRQFHTTAHQLVKKSDNKPTEEKICSGCPGIRALQDPKLKTKSKCSVLKGGVRGRCKVDTSGKSKGRINALSLKCKAQSDSPCMRPRSEPILVGVANRFIHSAQLSARYFKDRINGDLASVWSGHNKFAFSQNSKDPLDMCCAQLEQLKNQIDELKKQKSEDKGKKSESNKDVCKDKTKDAENNNKTNDNAQQNPSNCKKVIEKKNKAEECAKFLEKQNEKLRTQLETIKCSKQETNQCEEIELQRKKAEEKVKQLIQQNEKLRKDLKELTNKRSKEGCGKNTSNDPCGSKKTPSNDSIDKNKQSNNEKEMNEALSKCVKACSTKIQKEQRKKELKLEKKKCEENYKKKQLELDNKDDKDGEQGIHRLVNAACGKLQSLARAKKPKKC